MADRTGSWDRNDPAHQQPTADETRQQRLADDIVRDSVGSAIERFQTYYKNQLPGAKLGMNVERAGNNIDVKMDWTSPQDDVQPGKHQPASASAQQGRDVAAFSALAADTISKVDTQLRQSRIRYQIVASYTGWADHRYARISVHLAPAARTQTLMTSTNIRIARE